MSFSKNSKDASVTPFSCAKHGDNNRRRSGNQNVAIKMGAGDFAKKHGVGVLLNKTWKVKITQTNHVSDDHHNNQVRSAPDRTDQRVLQPLWTRGHAHREDVQKHRDH